LAWSLLLMTRSRESAASSGRAQGKHNNSKQLDSLPEVMQCLGSCEFR
jgi:hypothetical protein